MTKNATTKAAATKALNTATLRAAEVALAAADTTMAKIIATNPPITLRKAQPPFHSLTVSIINQQLSQKAAATIAGRLLAAAGGDLFVPEKMEKLKDAQLRAAGLSAGKGRFVRALTAAAKDGVLDLPKLRRLTDDEVIKQLTAIHGIGKWTAEMFMMFALRRPDIVSTGDAALCRSARIHYGKKNDKRGDAKILTDAAKKWHPWRTAACLHLWRALR